MTTYQKSSMTQKKKSWRTEMLMRIVLLAIIMASRLCSGTLHQRHARPHQDNTDYLEKPRPSHSQKLIHRLVSYPGFVLPTEDILTMRTKVVKRKPNRMSLTDLADILSSLKQRYNSNSDMRMPSLRFR